MAIRHLLRILVALTVVGLACACAPSAPSETSPPPRSPSALASSAPARAPGSSSTGTGASVATMSNDVQSAADVVNTYWSTHWSQFFTGSYSPPRVYGLYDASNEPGCGGSQAGADNAFYCSQGDFLAFGAPLLAKGYAKNTNSWTYLVVAHEWGHAIQARLSEGLQSQARELQADCFAGAVLYGAAQDGTLRFDQGDEQGIVDSLNSNADQTAWTSSSDHGSTFERINAFGMGRSQGVRSCLPTS